MSTMHKAKIYHAERAAQINELKELAEGIDGTETAHRLRVIIANLEAALRRDLQ